MNYSFETVTFLGVAHLEDFLQIVMRRVFLLDVVAGIFSICWCVCVAVYLVLCSRYLSSFVSSAVFAPVFQLPGAPESSRLKNLANFSTFIKRYDIKLHTKYPFNYSQIWKVSLHCLQNWRNYAAFSRGNLAVGTLSQIISVIQDGANNTISNNTFWAEKSARNEFHQRSLTRVKLFLKLWSVLVVWTSRK